MKKYVVKNCPCYFLDDGYCSTYGEHYSCIPNCLIKLIVTTCEDEYLTIEETERLEEKLDKDAYIGKCARHNMAAGVLALLALQEVEDERCE